MRVSPAIASYLMAGLFAILIGLTIVRLVDWRLQEISINMPAITLPKQHIYIKLSQNELESSVMVDRPIELLSNAKAIVTETKQHGGGDAQIMATTDINAKQRPNLEPRNHFDSHRYKSEDFPMKNIYVTPEPTRDHKEHPAPYPRAETVLTDPPQRQQQQTQTQTQKSDRETYYLDPKDMTAEQLVRFQRKAKLDKMTIADYENWLLTFKSRPELLQAFHRGNLRILTRGGHLTDTDMPAVSKVPPGAQQEYLRLIGEGTIQNIPQPQYHGYKAWNYEQEVGAPSEEGSLNHLAFVNPDEPLKTWILTHDKYTVNDIKST